MAMPQALRSRSGASASRRVATCRRTASSGLGLLGVALVTANPASAQTAAVGLGTSDSFAVLGGSTVTNTGPSVISGDLGVSPGTAVTGFPPGTVIGGTIHANDAVARQAQLDLVTAYNDAAGRSSNETVSADLGGRTLAPGVYSSGSALGLTGDLTLDGRGDPNAVFVFQAGSTLTTASASRVLLTNATQACNVFWQVGSSATIGTASSFTGNILALTAITLTNSARLDGRALARNAAVTLDNNVVTRSACAAAVTAPVAPGVVAPGAGGGTPGGVAPGGPTTGGTGGGTTGGGTGGATPGAAPGAIPGTTPGRTTRTRRPGIARLRGPNDCVSEPFTIAVTGRSIRDVTFTSDGRRASTVRARPGRKVFRMRVMPDAESRRAVRVTAKVRFTVASRRTARTLRLTYQHCQPAQPRYTG